MCVESSTFFARNTSQRHLFFFCHLLSMSMFLPHKKREETQGFSLADSQFLRMSSQSNLMPYFYQRSTTGLYIRAQANKGVNILIFLVGHTVITNILKIILNVEKKMLSKFSKFFVPSPYHFHSCSRSPNLIPII